MKKKLILSFVCITSLTQAMSPDINNGDKKLNLEKLQSCVSAIMMSSLKKPSLIKNNDIIHNLHQNPSEASSSTPQTSVWHKIPTDDLSVKSLAGRMKENEKAKALEQRKTLEERAHQVCVSLRENKYRPDGSLICPSKIALKALFCGIHLPNYNYPSDDEFFSKHQPQAETMYKKELCLARCYTATEMCVSLGALLFLCYQMPALTTDPNCCEITKTACALCSGGCCHFCCQIPVEKHYQSASDWKLFLPSATPMSNQAQHMPDANDQRAQHADMQHENFTPRKH